MKQYSSTVRADYTKLLKLIRRRRTTLGAFARHAGISQADLYLMQIGEMMSVEGESNACAYFGCDCADIRDIVPGDTQENADFTTERAASVL